MARRIQLTISVPEEHGITIQRLWHIAEEFFKKEGAPFKGEFRFVEEGENK